MTAAHHSVHSAALAPRTSTREPVQTAARPSRRASRAPVPLPLPLASARRPSGHSKGPGCGRLASPRAEHGPCAAPTAAPGALSCSLAARTLAPRCLPYILVAVRKDTLVVRGWGGSWFTNRARTANEFPERGTVGDADEEGRAWQPARSAACPASSSFPPIMQPPRVLACRARALTCRARGTCLFTTEADSPGEESEGASDLDRLPDDSSSDDDASGLGVSALVGAGARPAGQSFAGASPHGTAARASGQGQRGQSDTSRAELAPVGSNGAAVGGAAFASAAGNSHAHPNVPAASGARRPAAGGAPSSRQSAAPPEDPTMRRIKAQVSRSGICHLNRVFRLSEAAAVCTRAGGLSAAQPGEEIHLLGSPCVCFASSASSCLPLPLFFCFVLSPPLLCLRRALMARMVTVCASRSLGHPLACCVRLARSGWARRGCAAAGCVAAAA
jgi:hypothetical protein